MFDILKRILNKGISKGTINKPWKEKEEKRRKDPVLRIQHPLFYGKLHDRSGRAWLDRWDHDDLQLQAHAHGANEEGRGCLCGGWNWPHGNEDASNPVMVWPSRRGN